MQSICKIVFVLKFKNWQLTTTRTHCLSDMRWLNSSSWESSSGAAPRTAGTDINPHRVSCRCGSVAFPCFLQRVREICTHGQCGNLVDHQTGGTQQHHQHLCPRIQGSRCTFYFWQSADVFPHTTWGLGVIFWLTACCTQEHLQKALISDRLIK